MSQSHQPTDTQAVLQSMLQRLKLQSGRDGQAFAQSPVAIAAASTSGQEWETRVSNLQEVNKSPVNALGVNGFASNKFRITAGSGSSDFGFKGGGIQQLGPHCEVGGHPGSFLFPKVHTDGDTGERFVLGQATWPGVIPAGAGQVFPAKSPKDADLTSFEGTTGEMESFGSSSMKSHIPSDTDSFSSIRPNQNQVQGFTPKVYVWSMKNSEADTVGQENKGVHMGNGESGGLEQSKDIQIVSNTTNSRRKQRSSENRTKRWTQKIKERWKDRQGSFGKKGKEDGGIADQRIEQATQVLMEEHFINTPKKEESRDPSKTNPQTEEDAADNNSKSTSDFEIGLGSFSLLEEIVKGQEWAKFINPNLSPTSVNHRPSEQSQPKVQPYPHNTDPSGGNLNQLGVGNNQWSFRITEPSPAPAFSTTQSSPQTFLPAGMNVLEGNQQQSVGGETDRSEEMEDGYNHSCGGSGQGLQLRPSSLTESVETPKSSVVRNRLQASRKRQHQSAVSRHERVQAEKISDGEETEQAGSKSSPSSSSCHMMDETGESQQNNVMSVDGRNCASPSSSSSSAFAPPPRSVLRHTMSQDSETSMETLTKRRRVEENRRVHFSENIVTISSPDLDLDDTESEEDSGAEEDSMTEQECELEQAAIEEVASVRRHTLPAWIQALKRRNRGRKHR